MTVTSEEAKIKYEKVLELFEYGAREYKYSKKAPFTPLTITEALKELDIEYRHWFYSYMNTHEAFAKKYYFIRENKRENIRVNAEDNLERLISWELELENKDLWDLSLKVLKSIDSNYNQKQEIENTFKASLEMSTEEIMARINELNNGNN